MLKPLSYKCRLSTAYVHHSFSTLYLIHSSKLFRTSIAGQYFPQQQQYRYSGARSWFISAYYQCLFWFLFLSFFRVHLSLADAICVSCTVLCIKCHKKNNNNKVFLTTNEWNVSFILVEFKTLMFAFWLEHSDIGLCAYRLVERDTDQCLAGVWLELQVFATKLQYLCNWILGQATDIGSRMVRFPKSSIYPIFWILDLNLENLNRTCGFVQMSNCLIIQIKNGRKIRGPVFASNHFRASTIQKVS